MKRPENVDFVLKDIKSNILDSYVNSLENRIDKAIETIKDEGLVVAIKIINEKNDEILLSSKDLLIDILKGSDEK